MIPLHQITGHRVTLLYNKQMAIEQSLSFESNSTCKNPVKTTGVLILQKKEK